MDACEACSSACVDVVPVLYSLRPRPDHYFPDLHHMKYEIEDGTMLDGRPVRFGYNPLEFEGFSWRGYAQMSPVQVRLHPGGRSRTAELSLSSLIWFLQFLYSLFRELKLLKLYVLFHDINLNMFIL